MVLRVLRDELRLNRLRPQDPDVPAEFVPLRPAADHLSPIDTSWSDRWEAGYAVPPSGREASPEPHGSTCHAFIPSVYSNGGNRPVMPKKVPPAQAMAFDCCLDLCQTWPVLRIDRRLSPQSVPESGNRPIMFQIASITESASRPPGLVAMFATRVSLNASAEPTPVDRVL